MKRIMLLGIISFLLLAVQVQAASWSDDFNRDDSSTVGNGWDEYDEVAGDAQISSNTLLLPDASGANIEISRNHTFSTDFNFSFDIKDSDEASTAYAMFGDGGGYTNAAGIYYIDSDYHIFVNSTGQFVIEATSGDNTWYTIWLIARNSENHFDVYIDGVLKVDNATFKEDRDTSIITFMTGGGDTNNVWYDNVIVTELGDGGGPTNTTPQYILNAPVDDATGVSLNVTLNITYFDEDGDMGTVYFLNQSEVGGGISHSIEHLSGSLATGTEDMGAYYDPNNGSFFIIGGDEGSYNVRNWVRMYDIATDTVTTVSTIPTATKISQDGCVYSQVYGAGVCYGGRTGATSFLDDIQFYNSTDNTGGTLKETVIGNMNGMCASFDPRRNSSWVVCGHNNTGGVQTAYNFTQFHNHSAGNITRMAQIPKRLAFCGCEFVMGSDESTDRMYVYGGSQFISAGVWDASNTTYVYFPTNNTYVTLPFASGLPYLDGADSISSEYSPIDGNIYAFGSTNTSVLSPRVYRDDIIMFDTSTEIWSITALTILDDIEDFPSALDTSNNQSIYLFGVLQAGSGDNDQSRMTETERFNVTAGTNISTVLCTNTSVTNNSFVVCNWDNLNSLTTYYWYVNLTDGNNTNQSEVWAFTTEFPDTTDPTSNSPSDAVYINNTFQTIGWIIQDNYSPGYYRVFRNGTIQNDTTAWVNNTNLNVLVNTSTIGYWEYVIEFNDSAGNDGTNDTVMIEIYNGSVGWTETYNSNVIEQSNQTFQIVFTADMLADINATLIWNGTEYTPSKDGSTFTMNLVMPVASSWNHTVYFHWTYNISYTIGADNSGNTTNHSQTYYMVVIANCSNHTTTEMLIFYHKNEEDESNLNGTMDIDLAVWDEGESRNYSFMFPSNESHRICIYPNWATYQANATIEYEETIYTVRNYFLEYATISNTTSEINLFMLNQSLGNTITITVQDSVGSALEDVIVRFQRDYIGQNKYQTVAMTRTDYLGEGATFLRKDDIWYKYVLIRNGIVLRTLGPSILTSTDLVLVTSPTDIDTHLDYTGTMAHSCEYQDSNQFIVCQIENTNGLMQQVCLDVDEVGIVSLEDFNETCTTSSSATLMVNGSELAASNTTMRYILSMFNSNGDEFILEDDFVEFAGAIVYGLLGIFITIMIFATLSAVGIWNPAVGIITGTMGIVISYAFGFIQITMGALGSLIIVAGILAYKVKS